MNLKQRIKSHISSNRWQYSLITLIFIIGVIMGGYQALNLEGGVKNHLKDLINNYLQLGMPGKDGQAILLGAYFNQVKSVAAIWFLGLTVIGFPLILAVVFYRGFSLGFAVSFLVHEKAQAGIVISVISILPQNLVYIPFLLIWAVIGINFSVYVVRRRSPEALPLGTGLASYSLLMVLFLFIFLIGAFIEAYLSPWLLGLFL